MPTTERDTEQPEEAARKPAKKPEARTPVRLVDHKADSALVEWSDEGGNYRRVYVPLSRVEEGTVADKDLEKGIPYGLPWEDFVIVEATPEGIANELRRQGCWRLEDLNHARLGAVNRAFDQGEFIRRVTKEART